MSRKLIGHLFLLLILISLLCSCNADQFRQTASLASSLSTNLSNPNGNTAATKETESAVTEYLQLISSDSLTDEQTQLKSTYTESIAKYINSASSTEQGKATLMSLMATETEMDADIFNEKYISDCNAMFGDGFSIYSSFSRLNSGSESGSGGGISETVSTALTNILQDLVSLKANEELQDSANYGNITTLMLFDSVVAHVAEFKDFMNEIESIEELTIEIIEPIASPVLSAIGAIDTVNGTGLKDYLSSLIDEFL